MKNCVLLLNPQNDFLSINGSYTQKEHVEVEQLSQVFNEIDADGIVLMMDSHYPMDISHSNYWIDFEGNHPAVGTKITKREAKGRKYCVFMPGAPKNVVEEKQKLAVEYLENIESIGLSHHIVPNHCIIGTWGHGVHPMIMNDVIRWSNDKGRDYQMMSKGIYQHSEHIGAFEAVVPDPNIPETMLNQGILQYLDNFENVYIWGPSDVLLASMKQLEDCSNVLDAPDIIERYVVLTSNDQIKQYCDTVGFKTTTLKELNS